MFNLCLAEAAGGVGLGLAEAALVFEELGRALVPGPLVASHLAAGLIDGADDGSVVVGLVETDPNGSAGSAMPVVIEHLDDLDVLLVLSDEGVAAVDPRSIDATRAVPPYGPVDPRVVRAPDTGEAPRWPDPRSQRGGVATVRS